MNDTDAYIYIGVALLVFWVAVIVGYVGLVAVFAWPHYRAGYGLLESIKRAFEELS